MHAAIRSRTPLTTPATAPRNKCAIRQGRCSARSADHLMRWIGCSKSREPSAKRRSDSEDDTNKQFPGCGRWRGRDMNEVKAKGAGASAAAVLRRAAAAFALLVAAGAALAQTSSATTLTVDPNPAMDSEQVSLTATIAG